MSVGYKPSPLGYGNQRNSPFRRPESPASPAALRQNTPIRSPPRSGLASARAMFEQSSSPTSTTEGRTPRQLPTPRMDPAPQAGRPRSPVVKSFGTGTNALSQLQPTQVRMLRDGFQILDRDSDGVVGKEDVVDMLKQLGEQAQSQSHDGCRNSLYANEPGQAFPRALQK